MSGAPLCQGYGSEPSWAPSLEAVEKDNKTVHGSRLACDQRVVGIDIDLTDARLSDKIRIVPTLYVMQVEKKQLLKQPGAGMYATTAGRLAEKQNKR